GVGFTPLRGERDEEHQFGISIPVRGWIIESDYFRTGVRNFFDHNPLSNSNIFFPLTIARARIRAFEVTARSPLLFGRGRFHLAYSRQKIKGQGAVTGGLTDFTPPADFFLLDHVWRHTLRRTATGLRRSEISVSLLISAPATHAILVFRFRPRSGRLTISVAR